MKDTNQASEDGIRDLFGYYCTIEMKRHGVANEHYQHKIIGKFKSNTWVETPIQSPAKATIHDYQEDVVNVICCGVVEETVYRVRLSDIKNIHNHFIRTEKLKLLAEVRERVVGEDDKQSLRELSRDMTYKIAEYFFVINSISNGLRREQRESLEKMEAEL